MLKARRKIAISVAIVSSLLLLFNIALYLYQSHLVTSIVREARSYLSYNGVTVGLDSIEETGWWPWKRQYIIKDVIIYSGRKGQNMSFFIGDITIIPYLQRKEVGVRLPDSITTKTRQFGSLGIVKNTIILFSEPLALNIKFKNLRGLLLGSMDDVKAWQVTFKEAKMEMEGKASLKIASGVIGKVEDATGADNTVAAINRVSFNVSGMNVHWRENERPSNDKQPEEQKGSRTGGLSLSGEIDIAPSNENGPYTLRNVIVATQSCAISLNGVVEIGKNRRGNHAVAAADVMCRVLDYGRCISDIQQFGNKILGKYGIRFQISDAMVRKFMAFLRRNLAVTDADLVMQYRKNGETETIDGYSFKQLEEMYTKFDPATADKKATGV